MGLLIYLKTLNKPGYNQLPPHPIHPDFDSRLASFLVAEFGLGPGVPERPGGEEDVAAGGITHGRVAAGGDAGGGEQADEGGAFVVLGVLHTLLAEVGAVFEAEGLQGPIKESGFHPLVVKPIEFLAALGCGASRVDFLRKTDAEVAVGEGFDDVGRFDAWEVGGKRRLGGEGL